MLGKSKPGRVAIVGLILATATPHLCLAQHHEHGQPAPQHEVPQRAPHPSYQNPGSAHRYPPATPQYRSPAYSAPRAPVHATPYGMQQRPVAASPAQNQPPPRSSGYSSPQRHDVPRPPASGPGRADGQTRAIAQDQRHEVAHPPTQLPPPSQAGASRLPQASTHEVPRPPQAVSPSAGAPTGREVPRPPQAGQPRHGGDWLRSHQGLSLADQQKALQSDPQFRKLPTQQQQRLENRLQHFNSLPPQEQQRRLDRIEKWEHLTPQQKTQARQLAGQWNELTPQRRQMMKTAIGDLRAMPPDQRDRVLESPRFKSMFSDHERDMLRETTKLPLAPAETKPPPE